MFDCYENIIGLTQSTCSCFATGRPSDYNHSQSGIFLDELTTLKSLSGLKECDKTIWDIMKDARASAIKQFVADTNGKLGLTYKLRRTPYSGIVGTLKERDNITINKNYAVIRIAPAAVRSGYFNLKAIGLIYSQTGVITCELHDSVNGFRDSFEFNTIANKMSRNIVNLNLDMHSKYDRGLEYYLVFTKDANNKPKDNRTNCGCGNANYTFDKKNPYYNNVGAHGDEGWADWLMVGSTTINDLSELDTLPKDASDKMFGVFLELDTMCKISEVLCKDSLDFEANPSALSLAFAIQYKAGVYAAQAILKTDILTRETMINCDQLNASITEWDAKYNEHVSAIVNNAVITGNDCLACKDVWGLSRTGLFS